VPRSAVEPSGDRGADRESDTEENVVSSPAEVLNLKNWKLTLPIKPDEHVPTKKNGDAYEVFQDALDTFADKRCFSVTDDGKGVVLTVHHGGLATQGSENPRCELREMKNNGKDERNWDGTEGTHTLVVEGQVNRVTTSKKTVVLAQVHNKRDHNSDDVTVFRLVGTKLHITDGNDADAFIVPGDFPLKTRYTLKIEVKNGTTRYWVNGKKQDFTTKNRDRKNYFKAGNYLQSHGGGQSTDKLAEVVLYSVTVSHS
jgi:hypothetical protein